MHTHYAADGETITGYTVVEQDSPWNDRQRTRMLALAQYQRDVHACGMHRSQLEDPENNVLVPDEEHCAICAALDVQARVKAAEDEQWLARLGQSVDPKVPRPSDGRHLFLRAATPSELAERAEKRRQRETGRGVS